MEITEKKCMNNKGLALVMTLIIMVGLSLMATGVILITMTEVFVTRNEALGKEAFWAAEAGIQHAERVFRRFQSRTDVTLIYQKGYNSRCFDYGPEVTGHPDYNRIGYLFYEGNTVVESDGSFTSGSDRKYTVYIANNYGRHEIDVNGDRVEVENDGIVMIRSVGESSHNTRRILEQQFFIQEIVVAPTSDMKGGGPGGMTPQ